MGHRTSNLLLPIDALGPTCDFCRYAFIYQSLARHKRALEDEDRDFTERLAEVRKREEVIRRKETGRVVKKAVRRRQTLLLWLYRLANHNLFYVVLYLACYLPSLY